MSAFVCSEITFQRIVTGLIEARQDTSGKYPPPPLPADYWNEMTEAQKREAAYYLINTLFDINVAAVRERYGDDAKDMIPSARPKVKKVPITPMIFLKALDCFIYQACESTKWTNQALVAELERYADELAHSIVHRLPQWDATPGWE